MIDWLDNDALFRSEIARGHAWEVWVAAYLRLRGLPAEVQPQRVRPDASQRGAYADDGDLRCLGHVIEVKARRIAFTSPETIPYAELIVEADAKWRRKKTLPSSIVCVSEPTGAMIVIGPSEIARADQWKVIERRDRTRAICENFRVLPRSRWHGVGALVRYLEAERDNVRSDR